MMDQIQMTSEQQKQNEHMKMEQPKSILHAAEQMEQPAQMTKTESSILDRMNALPTECCVMEQQLKREVEEAGKLGRLRPALHGAQLQPDPAEHDKAQSL